MTLRSFLPFAGSFAAFAGGLLVQTQTAVQASAPQGQLDVPGLKTMVANLGYEVKDISAAKFQFTETSGTVTIPMAIELSTNKEYVYCTVNLGTIKGREDKIKEKAMDLLRESEKVAPSHFYITSGDLLMIAWVVNNRNVNPVQMRGVIRDLAQNVAKTTALWNVK